ncbi:MAG TPA: hypothetical protein VKY89_13895 [Thermoanaerobaculia bacterium]|nr:hypothetical protein [Thermoanaerobaculia bacterium]
MHIYNVSYDLKKPGRNYAALFTELKRIGDWWHYLESTWLIATDETASQVWNRISPAIDQNDRVLIIEVVNNTNGWLTQEAWDWINQHFQAAAA